MSAKVKVAEQRAGGVTLSLLDEAFYAIPSLSDFCASVQQGVPSELQVVMNPLGAEDSLREAGYDTLRALPVIDRNCFSGGLQISVTLADMPFTVTGAKRRVEVSTR